MTHSKVQQSGIKRSRLESPDMYFICFIFAISLCVPIILKCHTVDGSEIPRPTTERMVRKKPCNFHRMVTISTGFLADFGTIIG